MMEKQAQAFVDALAKQVMKDIGEDLYWKVYEEILVFGYPLPETVEEVQRRMVNAFDSLADRTAHDRGETITITRPPSLS